MLDQPVTIRRGRFAIAYVPERGGRVFWQVLEGVRRPVPAASGYFSADEAAAHLAGRLADGFRVVGTN